MDQPRYRGTLKKWNAERGFGFIAAEDSGQDVFVHITAFIRDGRDPRVGEELTFEVEPDRNGKRSAVRVRRPGDPVLPPAQTSRPRQPRMSRSSSASWPQKFVVVVLLVLVAVFGYSRYANRVKQIEAVAPHASQAPSILFESPQSAPALPTPASQPLSVDPVPAPAPVRTPAPLFESKRPTQASFSCDGRQHCSQMTSCEEANFFLKNCPNTKMDGDHDGKPCEQGPC